MPQNTKPRTWSEVSPEILEISDRIVRPQLDVQQRLHELERQNYELRIEANRLDFYAKNTSLFFDVVGTWYYRKGYAKTARRAESLRDAIDKAMLDQI